MSKSPTSLTIAALIPEFAADLKRENKSPATIRAYLNDLNHLAGHHAGEIEGVTVQILRDYLDQMEGVSEATKARRRASARSFFEWAVGEGYLDRNPADRLKRIKLPEYLPRPMAVGDLDRVLAVIKDKRDALLFNLLADTGVRVSEALSIKLEDIRLHAQQFSVIGKGSRERTAYLAQTKSLGLLKRYLKDQCWLGKDGETVIGRGLLFRPNPNKQRGGPLDAPIHYTCIQKKWRKYCQDVGVVGVTIHQIRHAHATKLINEGKPVEIIRLVLGHRNIQTTLRYAEVEAAVVQAVLEGRSIRR